MRKNKSWNQPSLGYVLYYSKLSLTPQALRQLQVPAKPRHLQVPASEKHVQSHTSASFGQGHGMDTDG